MKEKLYKAAPDFLQNLMISMYNKRAYAIRYGGLYQQYRKEKKENRKLSREELKAYQKKRYREFIEFVLAGSPYYQQRFKAIPNVSELDCIQQLPILTKEDLRKNRDEILVRTTEKLIKSSTGGTTGKSLDVYNFARNTQERFAFLDDFRSRFGYELGKKTAWFSGKNLLTNRDVKKNRFWKTDYFHKVRYYSTFHIKQDYLKYYLENLIQFKPEFFVGFPSTMLEIAKYGLQHDYDFPENCLKAVFPTAESVLPEMRATIEKFFKTRIYDQYASSEGAPFIFECSNGNLHLELQSGVFEVLNEKDEPAREGRLVVTSFTNEGTPLIRYDINDSVILKEESETCSCGNNNPMVSEILGRVDDYIYSPENGKINLGNISNTLKETEGIKLFQVLQNDLNKIKILIITDPDIYTKKTETLFLKNWRDRVGSFMEIELEYVSEIPVEKSGKYRIVKNNIKHLL